MKLPVITDAVKCDSCVASKQMRNSQHCTQTIIKVNDQYTPECFINSKDIAQAERNFLFCPTYNLGLYSVCDTCPLDCTQNPNKQKNTPLKEIINLLGGAFGLDEGKKKNIDSALEKLNTPEFKEVYESLERASRSIKDVMSGTIGSADVARKVIEVESRTLKNSFDNLIKDGKISKEDANKFNTEINSMENLQGLKSMIATIKKDAAK